MLTYLRWKILKLLGLDGPLATACKLANEALALNKEAKEILERVRSVTTIDADLTYLRGQPNTIIVTGRYQNRAYVNVFDIQDGDFEGLIKTLKDMQQMGRVRHIDAPPIFRAVIERDLE